MSVALEAPAVGARIHEGRREAGPLQRVGSILNSASSIVNTASLNLVSYQSAEAALAGIPVLPVKKRAVRFVEERAGQETVAPEPDQPVQVKSPQFDRLTVKFGMHPDAAPAWRALHEQPEHIFFVHWGAELGRTVLDSVIFVYGVPAAMRTWRILAILGIAASSCRWPGLWRHGPAYSHNLSYSFFNFVYIACILPVIIAAFVRSASNIPFQNRLKSTLLIAVCGYLNNVTGLSGQIKDEHPFEPMRSVTRALVLAGLRSARVMDGLTDLGMIRILLEEKASEDCEVNNTCSLYLNLAVLAGVFATLDFAIGFGLIFFSTKLSQQSLKSLRTLRRLHTVSLICELGIMAVTVIKLAKEASARGSVAQTIAVILLSLVTTIGSFVITLIAIQKLFKFKIGLEERQDAAAGSTDETTLESDSRFASTATWL